MQYGQIVFLLFVVMVFYYAAMIFMDFQRVKAAQNAEQDSQKEEDIDISEEARSFRPIRINRDEPESKEENQEENNTGNPEPDLNPKKEIPNRIMRRIPNLRMKIVILTVQKNLHPNQNSPDTFTGRPS